jgi:hypothetical protein
MRDIRVLRLILILLLPLGGLGQLTRLNLRPFDNELSFVCLLAPSALLCLWAAADRGHSMPLRRVCCCAGVVFLLATAVYAAHLPSAYRAQDEGRRRANETFRWVGEQTRAKKAPAAPGP